MNPQNIKLSKANYKVMNPRLAAVQIITNLLNGNGSLSVHFYNAKYEALSAGDRSLLKEICFGVTRLYPRLSFIANQLLSKKIRNKDKDIYVLILIGIYQVLELRVADHAAVSETVNIAKNLKKKWAVGLINAVLRNCIRQKGDLIASVSGNEEAKWCLPDWLIKRLKNAWPDNWQQIAEYSLSKPPLSVRVNGARFSREEYLTILSKSDIRYEEIYPTIHGVIILDPCPVDKIPGFIDGGVSVQDGSAQFAAGLLDLKSGMRVLDACAAPGGKTCHILESCSHTEVVALDIEEQRLKRVSENLSRLSLSAEICCGDAANPEEWWDGKQFDRILLDAPCSGIGVIRRNPDIKVMRTPDEIDKLSKQQLTLLQSIWPLLKPGGILLYATCSVLPQENELLIKQWLEVQKDAKIVDIAIQCGHSQQYGWQILTGDNNLDGFYYAKIGKIK